MELSGQFPVQTGNITLAPPKIFRASDFRPVRQCQECLETEVHADGSEVGRTITCRAFLQILGGDIRSAFQPFSRIGICDYVQAVSARRTSPDADGPDLPGVWTGVGELETTGHLVYDQHVPVELVASASLEHERGEPLCLLELRGSLRQTPEESHVCFIKPLEYLLDCLAVKQEGLYPPAEVLLHPDDIDILAEQGVVPPLQGEGMVPDKAGLLEHPAQM